MELSTREDGDITILTVTGDLVIGEPETAFKKTVTRLLEEGRVNFLENLSQTSGWAARWSASMSGADAALLWAPDTVHPLFLCIGVFGDGIDRFLRRSAPRETGVVHDLVRDRQPIVLAGDELSGDDPFLRGL